MAGEISRGDPENVNLTVAIPVPVHEAPEDEIAVAIDEIAIDPTRFDGVTLATRSVTVVPELALTVPNVPVELPPVIPALPEADGTRRRRRRGRAAVPTAPAAIESGGRTRRPAPEGVLQRALYTGTFHAVNAGDSYRARERKALDARIAKPFADGTRFVPVLTRKGGVGQTTVSTLLGMAMAEVRDDRVLAIDANPDRGTLAERVVKSTRATVRDVVARAASVRTFAEFQTLISRDDTRLDILASDTDPGLTDPFDAEDYDAVADLAERFYSVVITDCGTGVVHSVVGATLQRADSIVVVSGGSADEARLASEMLTWLESNGYEHLVGNAVVAINTATHGTNLAKLEEIEAHFSSRVRDVVRVPYDPSLATGSLIHYDDLKPLTRSAARDLAALVVDGLPEYRS